MRCFLAAVAEDYVAGSYGDHAISFPNVLEQSAGIGGCIL